LDDVRGGPGHRGDADDRRNRRQPRDPGGEVYQGKREEAGRWLYRRPDRSAGQADGTRGRHHFGRQRNGERKDGSPGRCGRCRREESRGNGRSDAEGDRPPEEVLTIPATGPTESGLKRPFFAPNIVP